MDVTQMGYHSLSLGSLLISGLCTTVKFLQNGKLKNYRNCPKIEYFGFTVQ